MFVTGGEDRTARLWAVQMPDARGAAASDTGGGGAGGPVLSVSLLAVWTLAAPITVLVGYRSTGMVVAGACSLYTLKLDLL